MRSFRALTLVIGVMMAFGLAGCSIDSKPSQSTFKKQKDVTSAQDNVMSKAEKFCNAKQASLYQSKSDFVESLLDYQDAFRKLSTADQLHEFTPVYEVYNAASTVCARTKQTVTEVRGSTLKPKS